MNYQAGKVGRIFIVRLDDGEDPLEKLTELSRKEKISSAVFWLLGGLKRGRFVVGPEDDQLPPKPLWREILGNNEVVGIGTIFLFGDEPKLHLHGVYGREGNVGMGCLRENPKVFLVLEAIVMEIVDVKAERHLDEKSGLALLKL